MKNKVFTLVFAFLAMAGNAIWGQSYSDPEEIEITGIEGNSFGTDGKKSGNGWEATHGDIEKEGNKLVISANGYYEISDKATTEPDNSNVQIIVKEDLDNVFITVKNVKTNVQLNNDLDGKSRNEKYGNRCAFEIGSGTTVTLNWEGENKFWSSPERAGINVKPGATLILAGPDTGENSLEAGSLCNTGTDNTNGAGIGGDEIEPNFGTIIIESGHVKARCESKGNKVDAQAAGIGGGYDPDGKGTSGTIIIKGGTIEAACWSNDKGEDYNGTNGNDYAWGAGIGGGMGGTVDNIIILGGNVKAYSTKGDDIGTGANCYNHPNIIIGNAEKGGNTQVSTTDNNELTVDETNYFDGLSKPEKPAEGYTNKGTVTMPEGTQLYYPYKISDEAKFYAYNVKLDENMFSEESHSITSKTEYGNRRNYYYGANMSFTEGALSCSQDHLFLGWYDADATTIVPIKEEKATFIMPPTPPTSLTPYEYDAVWVDNEMDITVRTGTTWAGETGDYTPEIEYVPTDLNVNNLTFSLSTYDGSTTTPSEFTDLKFEGNQLQGKVNLQDNDTYKKIVIKAKVKLGDDGEEKETTINVIIVDEYMINSASVDLNKDHVYNGQLHNGTSGTEMDDWVLDVKMTKDIMDNPLQESATLREGKHYRIYQYTYNKGTNPETAQDDDTESLPIKDAGTYSNITIEAINDALFDFTLDPKQTGKYTLAGTDQVITVKQREMNILLKAEVTTLDELNQLEENDDVESLVNFEEMRGIRGLVKGEVPEVNGTISSVKKKDGTDNIYLVTIERSSFKIGESTTFLPSNYEMKVGSEKLTNEGQMPTTGDEDLVIEVEIKGNDNDNTNDNIHIDRPKKYYHIYIDTVCPGLQLELSKDSVIEGGQVSVYLTVEEKCDTTGFTFEYKRGLKKWWQDLKPLEGVQPGEYIIKHIYSDIYIQALDAILEIEEEPTGIEDVEGAKVYAKEGTIYVYTPNHERVMIVSMNGAIVKSAEQEGMQSYSLNRGIYIVRIGDKVFKIKN
ncbi:hypothetical protein [Parabacteroides sp. An277]|uniref:hypothetical protein n=1 Tax=Parabacteroides sp. An277 TaxID=1965619 RepID=UPI001121A3C8|nr:hypothetical protein [Parabacteroides sp. An277]